MKTQTQPEAQTGKRTKITHSKNHICVTRCRNWSKMTNPVSIRVQFCEGELTFLPHCAGHWGSCLRVPVGLLVVGSIACQGSPCQSGILNPFWNSKRNKFSRWGLNRCTAALPVEESRTLRQHGPLHGVPGTKPGCFIWSWRAKNTPWVLAVVISEPDWMQHMTLLTLLMSAHTGSITAPINSINKLVKMRRRLLEECNVMIFMLCYVSQFGRRPSLT